jgi:hypothetical protein
MNSWSGHSDVTDTTVVFDRTSLLSSANPAKLIVLYILRSLISSAVFKYAEPRKSASPQANNSVCLVFQVSKVVIALDSSANKIQPQTQTQNEHENGDAELPTSETARLLGDWATWVRLPCRSVEQNTVKSKPSLIRFDRKSSL